MRVRIAVLVTALASLSAVAPASALTIERELRLDPARITVREQSGAVTLEARGGMHEFKAGRPDLPWVSERVDLPAGMKVSGVEVLDLETVTLREDVRVATAPSTRPGLTAIERTEADPAIYASASAWPSEIAALGAQGSLRGRNVAWLRLASTRWTPSTGRLEAVTRLRVRLSLSPSEAEVVPRERIVREWEDELPSGVPSKAVVSLARPVNTGAKPQAEPFKPLQLPSVLGSPVEYVIVTNDAMAATFQQLADWKTQSGVPAVVRTISFIRAQYPYGVDDAERIRMFLRDAYSRWGTKWVLLGGDTDIIPERLAYNYNFYTVEHIAADLYYSCLDGNWNANGNSEFGEGYVDEFELGDQADLMPELYVGRATVSTVAEAQTFLAKTLSYSKTPTAGYTDRWLLFAEVLFPTPYTSGPVDLDGARLAEDVLAFTDRNPSLSVKRLYENHTEPSYRPGALPESRTAVLAELNLGYGLALHVGHGYRNSMSVGDVSIVNADVSALTNGNKLFNLYAIDCTSSAIDFPCIGEAFLKNPNGGAVTVVGSTRFDFPTAGRAYQQEYFRLFFQDSVSAVGELQARQKLPFLPYAFYDGVNRWTQMTLLMLGDPELRMYNGAFRTLDVSGPSSFSLGDSSFTVSVLVGGQPLANARVTAYKANDEFRSVLTGASGSVTVPFRPDSTGAFTLTVTAYNAKPFQVTLNVTAAAGAALSEAALTVDDDNLDGTSGNGNGLADAGEVVDLRVALRNRGGASTSGAVSGTLSTTDPNVTLVNASGAWGAIAAGATGNPLATFRISVPAGVPDQREVAFSLVLWDGVRSWREAFPLTLHAPELDHHENVIVETVGNNNGRPTTGETAQYTVRVRNAGSGVARGVTAVLRALNASATVTDSTSTVGDIAAGATAQGDAFVFSVTGAAPLFQLEIRDALQVRRTQTLDLTFPGLVQAVSATGEADAVKLLWNQNIESDLAGYNIYRATNSAGPFVKANTIPTGRTAYYHDEGLQTLTRFYYRVTAVDSSGNESSVGSTISISTNPPTHAIFPVPMGRNTPSSVAWEFMYGTDQGTVVSGADVLYVMGADGSAPVDADGAGATLGDFTTRGSYYASAPAMSVLKSGEGMSVIGTAWGNDLSFPAADSAGLFVFDGQGRMRPGFPLLTPYSVWSAPTVADLDGDGGMEMAFGSNGDKFYVMRENGQELRDGDSNPATRGVFKVMNGGFHPSTAAAADIDGDGLPELVVGGGDNRLYVWNGDGSNVPGFPLLLNGPVWSSPAVAYLDGPGDTSPEIIFSTANDSVYVLNANGTRRTGWPVWFRTSGVSKSPSPAIADMNNDGFADIVMMGTNGGVYVLKRDGQLLFPWGNIRYTTLTSSASESSPVVADINGDGLPDVVCGGEEGLLYAFSGLDASTLPGFPIKLAGEIRGAPALGDIDRDGKTEIMLAGWDRNLYIWDYDFTFSPGRPAPWPQFHHDARHTGFASAPLNVGVDGPGGEPEVVALALAAPQPNPVSRSGRARFAFAVPASRAGQRYELAIHDLAGRLVRRVDSGMAAPGRFSVQWDLRDSGGSGVKGGVYFARLSLGGEQLTRKVVVLQ